MATAIKYKKQIMDLTNNLSEDKVVELINFAQFLKAKQIGRAHV